MLSNFFMERLGRASLISPDDMWSLLAILCVSVAAAIWLEQKYNWASKLSGAIIALIFALILSNVGILPVNSSLYDDIICGVAVPIGIPMLLLQCNLRKIWKEAGQMLVIFLIGAVGTMAGALLGFFLLKDHIPELAGVSAMMTGSYIGGGVNFAAMAGQFDVSPEMIGASTVADNMLMAIYFFVLILCAGMRFFRAKFPHPHIEEVESNAAARDAAKTQAAAFWSRKEISLKDIAMNLAYAVMVVFISKLIGAGFKAVIPDEGTFGHIMYTFLGSDYVWMTTISMIVATFGEKQVEKLRGSQEIGTYLIYLFLFVIGVPASIMQIITKTPLLFVFTGLMVLVNMIFCFVGGKLIHADLEAVIIASNANIGGPPSAAGMAISQGWSKLVGPGLLMGVLGYVIGNYAGVLIGAFLGA